MSIWDGFTKREYTPEVYALLQMSELGAYCPRVEDFEHSMDGLDQFLAALGTDEFLSAREICTPHNRQVAEELYGEGVVFLPPIDAWEVVGVLSIIHHNCRILAGSPIHVRNCLRPPEYNARVGGAVRSDHVVGRAFDMDYVDSNARQRCDAYLESLYQKDYLELSLGKGDAMWHVGVLSPGGHRRWRY